MERDHCLDLLSFPVPHIIMQSPIGHLRIHIPSAGSHSVDLVPCDGPYVLGRQQDLNDHAIDFHGLCTSHGFL